MFLYCRDTKENIRYYIGEGKILAQRLERFSEHYGTKYCTIPFYLKEDEVVMMKVNDNTYPPIISIESDLSKILRNCYNCGKHVQEITNRPI